MLWGVSAFDICNEKCPFKKAGELYVFHVKIDLKCWVLPYFYKMLSMVGTP
ncbi:hypothetical protein [Moraxella lacunata]|uniref:hypothetical protein n=1 Tax=Moraxella lacunata TaxID=477 RepID=UPI000A5A171E